MSLFTGRFSGRAAIITGGASGLGRSVAARIIAEGGLVSLWDINEESLTLAAREIGAAHSVAVDVSDQGAVSRAMAESRQALGGINILITSAGITGATAPVHDYPADSWLRVIDVNLNGLFYCCREAVPHMLEGGYGRIVNISSVAGKEGNPNASAYSASKAAVIGFTKSLGKELATKGVIANCTIWRLCTVPRPTVLRTELCGRYTYSVDSGPRASPLGASCPVASHSIETRAARARLTRLIMLGCPRPETHL